MLSGTLSGGGGGGGGRELDFREKKKKKMQKDGEFLLDGCPIPGNNPHHPRTRWVARLFAFLLYLITLAIVGAMTVLVIMAKPIIQHNGYQATTCRVNETRLWGNQECRCGIGCRSQLPCGQVYVNFALVDDNSTENVWVENKLIHEDQLNEKHYPICSISSNAKCYLKESYNLKDVRNFLDLYNETKHEESTFPCFYNRNNYDSVLLHIVPSTQFIQIILAASWGLVGIVILLLTCLGFVLIGCNRCMDVPPPAAEEILTARPVAPGVDDSGWEKTANDSQTKDHDSIPEAVRIDPSKPTN